jgi:hypothetical protein
MAKEVKVSIIVDDNGTMRLTEKSAKKLGAGLDKAGKSAQTADRQLKGAAQASSNSSKNFAKQAQGISGGLVPAYAILAATVFAASAAFNFLKSAGDLKVLQDGQIAYTATTGVAMKNLTSNIRTAAQGLLDFETASQAAAIGVASGLSVDQITALAKGAANVSKILGRDVTDSFNRLVRGVTKGEPELLDELGIILRLDDAATKYATTLGINAKELTQFQKRTAIFNDVQDQLETKFNRINEILKPENNAFAELGVAFSDVVKGFKEFLAAVGTPFARFFTDNVSSLVAALGLIAIPLFKQAIPGITQWGIATKEASETAAKSIEAAQQKIERLKMEQTLAFQPGGSQEKAATIARGSGLQGRKGSGLKALLDGQEALSKAQARGMARAARSGLGEYTKMSADMRNKFAEHLDEMAGKAQTTSQIITSKFVGAFNRISTTSALVAAKVESHFLIMKTAALKFVGALVKVAVTMIRIVSWVGILAIAFDLLKAGLERLGIIEIDQQLKKQIDTATELTRVQESLNDEYVKFAEVQAELTKDLKGPNAQSFTSVGEQISSLTKNFEDLNKVIKQGAIEEAKEGFTSFVLPTVAKALDDLFESLGRNEEIIRLGKKATDEFRNSNKLLVEGLVASKLTSTGVGAEFKALASILALGGTLTEKEAKRYEELAAQLQELGTEFGALQKARESNTAEYTKTISSITTYTTKVSGLLEKLQDQLKAEKKLDNLSGINKDRITRLEKEIDLIQKLNDLEVKYANMKLQQQINEIQAVTGAAKISKGRIKTEQSIAAARIDILELDAKLALGEEKGIKFTKDKLEQLRLQKVLKKEGIYASEQELKIAREELDLKNRINKVKVLNQGSAAVASPLNDAFFNSREKIKILDEEIADAQKDAIAAYFSGSEAEKLALDLRIATLGIERKLIERNNTQREESLKLKTKELGVTTKFAKQLSGATAFEKERIGFQKQSEQNILKLTELERQKLTLSAEDTTTMDNINAQIDGIIVQNELLAEQQILAFKIAETFRTTLESSLASNIADIIKGTETSFKDALLNIAKSVLSSIADTLAKSLTEDILSITGIYDTPASKMKSALEEGGDYIKEKIQEGLGVSNQDNSSSSSISTAVPASTLPKSGGEETFFSKFSNMFKNIFDGLKNALSGILKGLGSIGGGLGGFFSGIFGAAAGGIMPGGVTGYANGGIVKRPTLGLVGEGKMNEAVVPLPDGKAIPVNMGSGMGQNNNVTVNVSMDGQGNSQSQSNSDGQMGANMGKLIAGAVQEELHRQKRPGGILSPYGAA